MDESTDEKFCYFCQDTRESLGHSTNNCPKVACKVCERKGHTLKNCPILSAYETSNVSNENQEKHKTDASELENTG